MTSLAERISQLCNPTPIFDDPETNDDVTAAKLTDKHLEAFDDDHLDSFEQSHLRKKSAALLSESDSKYKGKKTSRSDISQDNELAQWLIQEGSESDSESEDASSNKSNKKKSTKKSKKKSKEKVLQTDKGSNLYEKDEDELSEVSDFSDSEVLESFKNKVKHHGKSEKNVLTNASDEEDDDDDDVDENDDGSVSDDDISEDEEIEDSFVEKDNDNELNDSVWETEDDENEGDDMEYDKDVEIEYDEDDDDDDNEDEIDDEDDSSLAKKNDTELTPPSKKRKLIDGKVDAVSNFSKSTSDDAAKGSATQCQLKLWDSLLKVRIDLQKVLNLSNQLPQPEFCEKLEDSNNDDYMEKKKEGTASLKKIMDDLVSLQDHLFINYPDTKNLYDSPKVKDDSKNLNISQESHDDDDEEITSESDTENKDEDKTEVKKSVKCVKIKHKDYPSLLCRRHEKFRKYRNDTIQKWYDKTRIASGKISAKGFTAFDQSALKQIEQVLSDQNRLIRRTQLKRSVYDIIGKSEPAGKVNESNNEENITLNNDLENYDEEIFDDQDFYHQLLRELIERKTSDINDPVALSRHWLEIQKLRGKVKKVVDTKASKGRKIRYEVHRKMVNFMAPDDKSTWSDEARNDLFSSLFGKSNNSISVQA